MGVMTVKTALLSFALALVAPVVHADTIQGGPRQQYDAVHCAAYEATWPEYLRNVLGVGVYEYGPEAPIPASPPQNPTPEQQAAADAFGNLALLQALYVGGSSLGPAIGYDEYGAAFAIANAVGPYGTGPILPAPWPPDYPGLSTDPEVLRLYRVDALVSSLSHRRTLTSAQLELIRGYLRQTPTCGGAGY